MTSNPQDKYFLLYNNFESVRFKYLRVPLRGNDCTKTEDGTLEPGGRTKELFKIDIGQELYIYDMHCKQVYIVM